MSTESTPAPWFAETDDKGFSWVGDTNRAFPIADFVSREDAARAVACVNACEGLEDPGAAINRLRDTAEAMHKALQALMKAYGHPMTGENGNSGECWDLARAAMSKAKPFLKA